MVSESSRGNQKSPAGLKRSLLNLKKSVKTMQGRHFNSLKSIPISGRPESRIIESETWQQITGYFVAESGQITFTGQSSLKI